MNIAFNRGLLLERWKKIMVLIPKDDGPTRIHRLRHLHIVGPEVSAMAKGSWAKKLTRIVEKTGNITADEFGDRKNRQAQSVVLNKLLYYGINRATMTESQYYKVDMKSHYDRKLARLVPMVARVKLGMHKIDAEFMVQFTEQQKFFVKTSYGISEDNGQQSKDEKLYGLGQGTAWSGPGWIYSSDRIARCNEAVKPHFGS